MRTRLTRRAALALLGTVACSRRHAQARERAAGYLMGRQAADGGWHSDTYGLLRSGQSLTPFVLGALLPLGLPGEAERDRAFAFLERHVDAYGGVGLADPLVADYPTYATALSAQVLRHAGRTAALPRLVAWLRSRQCSEGSGWPASHPAHGGWGMGAVTPVPPDPGHLDLSMTRHALQGLAAAGVPPGDRALVEARAFLGRCQNGDGGFLFSPVVPDANKAGRGRSYGTATADGVLALLATGLPKGDDRVRRALAWLTAHHRADRAPGMGEDSLWAGGLRYYYAAASAEAFRALGVSPDGAMADALLAEQAGDGSWRNRNTMVKEDDPLVATGLALRALGGG